MHLQYKEHRRVRRAEQVGEAVLLQVRDGAHRARRPGRLQQSDDLLRGSFTTRRTINGRRCPGSGVDLS